MFSWEATHQVYTPDLGGSHRIQERAHEQTACFRRTLAHSKGRRQGKPGSPEPYTGVQKQRVHCFNRLFVVYCFA